MKKLLFYTSYILLLVALSLYSYALIDPNLTLINAPWWIMVRDPLVQFGYYQRLYSWYVYLGLVILLFCFHTIVMRRAREFRPLVVAGIIAALLVGAYPFLSHDFFNYIFDAKILTYYGMNPYTHKALDFPQDHWIRFMHWTHRSYPYGPIFLLITLLPSWFGMGKFILHYLFFKALFGIFYVWGVWILGKSSRKTALEFATHPFVLIEGLISPHNDLIGVVLALFGLYYLSKKQPIAGWLSLICSIGIKYMTFPLVCIQSRKRWLNIISLMLSIAMLMYFAIARDIQQWYFFIFFGYMTIFPTLISRIWIVFFGALVSYYPFIFMGGWDSDEKVHLKYVIIGAGVLLNALVALIVQLRARYSHETE